MNRQLTVSFLPWWPANPYQTPLEQELNRANAPVIGSPPLNPLRQFRHLLIVLVAYRLLNIVWYGQFMSRARTNHATLDETSDSLMLASAKATQSLHPQLQRLRNTWGEIAIFSLLHLSLVCLLNRRIRLMCRLNGWHLAGAIGQNSPAGRRWLKYP